MTTIKINGSRGLRVEPGTQGVRFSLTVGGITLAAEELTTAQAAALVFSIEQALEAYDVRTFAGSVRTGE